MLTRNGHATKPVIIIPQKHKIKILEQIVIPSLKQQLKKVELELKQLKKE
jgi:hypothetical protein